MPQKRIKATGDSRGLARIADVMTLNEAAEAIGTSGRFVANAIRRERKNPGTGLKAFVPGGAEPGHGGHTGYHVRKADLIEFWFGEKKEKTPSET